jgi:hypothetical protein
LQPGWSLELQVVPVPVAPVFVQLMVFWPWRWLGQVFVPHWPVRHMTSQAHELSHLIEPHAGLPVQLTVHGPLPQLIDPHASVPVQLMSQPLEPHVIDPHAPPLAQSIVH